MGYEQDLYFKLNGLKWAIFVTFSVMLFDAFLKISVL